MSQTAIAPAASPQRFEFDLTQPEPIPETGIQRAIELMRTGRLFRYAEVGEGSTNDAAELEVGFADLIGRRYAVGVNSCGASLFVALRACGVQAGDPVLVNGFTLAPVPGAIHHAGALPVLVEITEDLTIDFDDLKQKARASGAKVLLLSHMRGHVADMDKLRTFCDGLGLLLIEDCAHTLGASWNEQPTGSFGAVGCFSTQTFKHINSGEGGVIVTDDDEIAARSILHSGSYMLFEQHRARPSLEVFEPLRGQVPNYSLRMTGLAAALALPQLDLLPERAARMNTLYRELEALLRGIQRVRVIERPAQEQYVGSSLQFALPDLTPDQIATAVSIADDLGLHVKWFGEPQMVGFTSRPEQWDYVGEARHLPRTEAILSRLCDLRIPPAMAPEHCRIAADIIRHAVATATA